MIKHVVCFKLVDNSSTAKCLARERLLSMIGNVKWFKSIECGEDFLQSPRSYDIVLITTFDSASDLDEYQKDDYHVNVVKSYMHTHTLSSVAVDFEY
ncbi:MAG: Dabb family protein [Christensenellaceae bacterium]